MAIIGPTEPIDQTVPQVNFGATGLGTGTNPDPNAKHYKYPANLGQPPFDKWIFFEARSGRHVVRDQVVNEKNGADRTLSSVGLYLSETALKNSLTVAYEENAMGPFMGAIVELLAQSGQDLRQGLASITSGGSGSKLKQALLSGEGLLGAGQAVGSAVGSVAKRAFGTAKDSWGTMLQATLFDAVDKLASGTASEIFGAKPNPRTDVLFDTQEYRSYDMSFILIPRSLEEAKNIDRIIHLFQFYMLPKYEEPASQGNAGNFMIGFPYEFEISLRDGHNNRLEHVNKFERCVLTNIIVDHAAGGKTAFVKGDNGEFYPVATSLSLSFKEVRLLDRNSDAITRVEAPDLPDPRI